MSTHDETHGPAPARFPWPPHPHESAAGALVETWKQSTFAPTAFFRTMPAGDLGSAILYYLAVGIPAAAIQLFWSTTFGLVRGSFMTMTPFDDVAWSAWSPVIEFLFTPLFLLLQLFVLAAVFHLALWILGGAKHPFAITARTLCFAYSPRLFIIIPVLGGFVGVVWMAVITVIGLREVHQTDTWRAGLAVLLPLLLFGGALIVIGILATIATMTFA